VKYYIIAGEASGDLHGARLVEAIIKKDPEANIRCWGGDLMEQAGADLVKHYRELAFMGFWEVITHLWVILNNFKFCKTDILEFKPDVIIYIDYPGFNLRVAKWARINGFKNHYYICPQIWAWKENRIHQIKRDIDALYAILPFEQKYFKEKHDYPVSFVGNPLFDTIIKRKKSTTFYSKNGFSETSPIVALLPGSRKQEIKKMLPIFVKVAQLFSDHEFIIAGAPGIDKNWYDSYLLNTNISVVKNQTYDLLEVAEAALVSSGTATLETAIFKVPQLVCYRSSFISYQIAIRLVKLKYISLVNLILNKEIVTELIQDHFNVKEVSNHLQFLLSKEGQKKLKSNYEKLFTVLGKEGASEKTAGLIIKAIRA
jgi:lipid-A-disaccharide synthase